jgi:Fe-S cluster assembly protein SufD
MVKLRQAAIERFAALGFPTTDDEEWRFTPLTALRKVAFEVKHGLNGDPGNFRLITDEDLIGTRLLLPNGVEPIFQHRGQPLPKGVIVCSLARALTEHHELVESHLARHADIDEQAFTALNTAFLHDGAFIYLPSNAIVEEPIDLTFIVSMFGDPPLMWPRRVLVIAGHGSQATIVERYVGLPGVPYFTNAVTEVVLDEDAIVDHYKVQQEGDAAFHIANTEIRLSRSSNFRSHSVTFGAALTRNDINADLTGEGAECTLNGLYLGTGEQLIDNHTRIDHEKPHCNSHELYKGILDGKARGVFNGKIYVHLDAQKTDAKQTNQTLLLSPDAMIDTKPQLEIFADDVKCTHGATVGQLDPESLFYLRARGIGAAEARALLTFAFANDVIDRIRVDQLRSELERHLLAAHQLPLSDPEVV